MDFINKAIQELRALLGSMTPAARLTAGLLLAVVVISLFYLFRFQSGNTGEFLLGGREFSQSDLANMEAAFGKAGLGDYRIEGYRIRVPRGQKAVYMAALADANALPQDFTRHLDEVLSGGGLFTQSRHLLEQRLKNAKEKNLSLIISEMKGIDYARVQFERDEQRGLRSVAETRAVAAVKAEGNHPLDEERVVAIRNTIVAGVAGLKPENVTVTDLNAGVAYPGTSSGSIVGLPNSPYAAHKRFHEAEYRRKILEMLRDYPGVVVGVSVELDETLSQEETVHTYDPKPVAVATVESTKSQSTSAAATGGRPGVVPNAGNSNRSASVGTAPPTESTLEENLTTQQAVAGSTTVTTSKSGLLPKRVYASIGIPSTFYEKIWRERHPATDGQQPTQPDPAELAAIEQETKKKIQEMIVTLLPKRVQGEDPYERVTVVTIDKLPPESVPQPSIAETALAWLAANWQSLAMLGLGAFSLLLLRNIVRSSQPVPSESLAEKLPLPDVPPRAEADGEPEQEQPKLKLRFGSKKTSLREQLVELVKEDPDAAANVLKSWIGDAA